MKIEVTAPSNIALIKYMGKVSSEVNLPANSSLSYTLDSLLSYVEIEKVEAPADSWKALKRDGLFSIELSEKGKKKFLNHFANLKKNFGIEGHYQISSANNFPSDCGLASSASSFAALTKGAVEIFKQDKQELENVSIYEMSDLSRKGSGSSCRSFYSPWSIWNKEGARPIEFAFSRLLHQVVVVDPGKKEVSSSDAHARVTTSLLYDGRIARAENRLAELLQAFRQQDWEKSYHICWAEFWDMHALFETSMPSFGYMRPGSFDALTKIKSHWNEKKDGPLVTMDAGANIHLLFRLDQQLLAKEYETHVLNGYQVLSTPSQSK